MEPKKIALFGCGGFAQNHIREISKWNNVVIAYLIDPSLENRERSAGVYKDNRGVSPQGFSSLDSFISSDPSFDAGVVVTPPDTHFEISESVLNSGKSVYVEKPFTVSVEDAIKLNSLAKQNGVDITIGANRCVFPAYRAAAIALREGAIGEMQAISFFYRHTWEKNTANNFRQDPAHPASGLIADHSPHYSHFLFTDLGFNPKEVRHIGTRYNERGIDVDASYLMIDSEGRNVFTVMDGSPSDNIRGEEIKIYGTKGDISIRFEGKGSNSYIQMHGKEAVKIDISRAIQDIRALGIEDPFSHPALIHNFLSRICGYSAMNGNPGMEGILPVHIIELIQRSRGQEKINSLNKQELSDLTQMVRDGTWQQEGALKDYDHRGMTVPVKLSF